MRIVVLVAGLALFAPSSAIAQTRTADGIAAILDGDHAAALKILKPLAEDPSNFDPLAAFFLATLHHSGKGVPRNEFRACGLYLKAAVPANPFASQSLAIAKSIHRDHPFARDMCISVSQNRWNEPPASTFSLARDHSVRIDSTGFVVSYQGSEKPVATPLGGAGWVFLPTKLTEIDVTRPVSARRHFIEFLIWLPQPMAQKPAWVLLWIPYEIVGLDASQAINGGVAITAADQPLPAVAETIRIRVNADGEAEWVIDGPMPRNGLIPSPGAR